MVGKRERESYTVIIDSLVPVVPVILLIEKVSEWKDGWRYRLKTGVQFLPLCSFQNTLCGLGLRVPVKIIALFKKEQG